MGNKGNCPTPPPRIPSWFLSYRGSITLLTAFFIFLITLSSSEPESFERMQVSAFGGGGGTLAAGVASRSFATDSLTLRYRPGSDRMTMRGDEVAPMDVDPVPEALAKGLQALETLDDLASAERVSVIASLQLLRDDSDNLTEFARQQMRMLAIQLRGLPLEVELQVGNRKDLAFSVLLARYALETQGIPSGSISVSLAGSGAVPADVLRMTLTRTTSEQ